MQWESSARPQRKSSFYASKWKMSNIVQYHYIYKYIYIIYTQYISLIHFINMSFKHPQSTSFWTPNDTRKIVRAHHKNAVLILFPQGPVPARPCKMLSPISFKVGFNIYHVGTVTPRTDPARRHQLHCTRAPFVHRMYWHSGPRDPVPEVQLGWFPEVVSSCDKRLWMKPLRVKCQCCRKEMA